MKPCNQGFKNSPTDCKKNIILLWGTVNMFCGNCCKIKSINLQSIRAWQITRQIEALPGNKQKFCHLPVFLVMLLFFYNTNIYLYKYHPYRDAIATSEIWPNLRR